MKMTVSDMRGMRRATHGHDHRKKRQAETSHGCHDSGWNAASKAQLKIPRQSNFKNPTGTRGCHPHCHMLHLGGPDGDVRYPSVV